MTEPRTIREWDAQREAAAKRYSSAVRALQGKLTERQCRESGAHATIERECGDVPHNHRPGPEELRAEALRLRSWRRDDSGTCRHGAYVGGSGIDWMCGPCEDMTAEEEARELDAYAAELEREETRG